MNRIALSILVAASVATSITTGVIAHQDGHKKGYAAGRGDQHEFESVKSIADVCYQLADKVEMIKTADGKDDHGAMRNTCDQMMVTANNNVAENKEDCFTTFVIHEGSIENEHRLICPAVVRANKARIDAEEIG